MAKVFVSYRREKSGLVDSLVEDMKEILQHDVWFDKHHDGNEQWWRKILEEIAERDAFIPVYDFNYDNSYPCCRELDYAVALQRHVIPVVVEKELPEGFSPRHSNEFNYIQYSGDNLSLKNLQKRLSRITEVSIDNKPVNSTPSFPAPEIQSVFNQHIVNRAEQAESEQILSLDSIENLIHNNIPASEIRFLLEEHKRRGPDGDYRERRPFQKYTDIKQKLDGISIEYDNELSRLQSALSDAEDRLEEKESLIAELQTQLESDTTALKEQLEQQKQENNKTQKALSKTEKLITKKNNELTVLENLKKIEVSSLGQQLAKLKIDYENTKTELTNVVDKLSDYKAKFADMSKPVGAVSKNVPYEVLPDLLPELRMIPIPTGTFLMGSPPDEIGRDESEDPQHEVSVATFELSETVITFDQYAIFAGETKRDLPDDHGWGRGNQPVINVSWDDALAYITWLNDKTSLVFRLPTEAEWEYAARAGTTTPFYTGDCISTKQANYNGNHDYNNCGANTGEYLEQTSAVKSYAPNDWGLYDMSGNVWEWTQDRWHNDYTNAPSDGLAWLEGHSSEEVRVLRGGSWVNEPHYLRSANRSRNDRGNSYFNVGFRLSRTI